MLNRVADKLKKVLYSPAFIHRYGGVGFEILFQGFSDFEVTARLDEVRCAIELIRFPEMNDRFVTVSIGMHKLQGSETKETLFKMTDNALYKLKRSGKNMLCISE